MPTLSEVRYQEQRAHILLAARMVFAKYGFHRASIRDIMEEAKVSNGAIFTYFKTKDEMILEIIDQNLGLFTQRIQEVIATSEALKFDEVIVALLNLVRQISLGPGRSMSMHVWSLAMLEPEVAQHTTKHFDRIIASLERLIKKFQKSGGFPAKSNPQKSAKALFSVLIPGYIVQLLLVDSIEPEAYLKAHRGLCQ